MNPGSLRSRRARPALALLGAFRALTGMVLLGYAFERGQALLALGALALSLGFFTRPVALLLALTFAWPGSEQWVVALTFLFLALSPSGNAFSLDRLARILRGKAEARSPWLRSSAPKLAVYFDGDCVFCSRTAEAVRALDVLNQLDFYDFRTLDRTHPMAKAQGLDSERAEREMLVLDPEGRWYGGYYAFRRLAHRIPVLLPLAWLGYLPGMSWIGTRAYTWVADHRGLLMGVRKRDSEGCGPDSCKKD